MLWQFWLGRFLQAAAGIGALLTVVDWARLGGTQLRVGRILLWSVVAGAVAATLATRTVRKRGCSR